MKKKIGSLIGMVLAITLIGFVGSAMAQDKAADNMDLVKEKVRTDKKLFIATNMELTESEAKAFWPVYEANQAELDKLRDREIKLIAEFAINSDHLKLRQSYLSKFRGVLPDKKVARYYQLESKINAVLEYEMAKRIPLVQ